MNSTNEGRTDAASRSSERPSRHRPERQRRTSQEPAADTPAASGAPPPEEGRLSRYRNEIIVGLVALLAVAVAVVGVRYMAQLPLFSGTYALVADFQDAGGLVKGRAVTMSGVTVGTVEAVRLDPEIGGVRVRLHVEEDIQIPRGSMARITGLAALDNVQLAIQMGPPGQPPLEDGARLPTDESSAMGHLTERAGPLAAHLDTALAGAAGTMQAAEQLLAGGDLEATFDNLRATSEGTRALVEGQHERLGRTLANVEVLTADLGRAAADVQRLTATGGDSLAVAAARMNRVLAELETTSASAARTSASLEAVAARIEAGKGTLGRLARDESLYRHTDSTMARLSRVLKGFEENPKRYLSELKLVDLF